MSIITNKSGTNRATATNGLVGASFGFNVKGANPDSCETYLLAPGEAVDADLFDPANPVYKAWEDAGDMDFGGALTTAKAAGPKRVVVQDKVKAEKPTKADPAPQPSSIAPEPMLNEPKPEVKSEA